MSQEITIPESIQQICRDLSYVASKAGLNKFSGKFTPDYAMHWGGEISFQWEQGRHGEDANELYIQSAFFVTTKVTINL